MCGQDVVGFNEDDDGSRVLTRFVKDTLIVTTNNWTWERNKEEVSNENNKIREQIVPFASDHKRAQFPIRVKSTEQERLETYTCAYEKLFAPQDRYGLVCSGERDGPDPDVFTLNPFSLRFTKGSVGGYALFGSDSLSVGYGVCSRVDS